MEKLKLMFQFLQEQILGMKWMNELIGKGLSVLGVDIQGIVSLLVLQNLLAVFKLPDLLQDFLPFFFWGLGCNFFVHVMHLFSLETLID